MLSQVPMHLRDCALVLSALLVMHLPATTVDAVKNMHFKSDVHLQGSCPSWIGEYASFHRQNKHSDGARYLVYNCPPSNIQGAGDRLRGMLYMTKLAISLQRLILFQWTNPAALETFLIPSQLDWGLNGTGFHEEHAKAHQDPVQWLCTARRVNCSYRLDNLTLPELKHRKFITFDTTVPYEYPCERCPPVPHNSIDAACLWQALWKVSPQVQQRADDFYRALFGTTTPGAYVAIHLRMGGMGKEEPNTMRRVDQDHNTELLAALACAHTAAKMLQIDTGQRNILLITDNHAVRRAVVAGHFHNIAAPDIVAHHIALSKDTSLSHIDVFAELSLLAKADWFIRSRSGFSDQALLLGRPVASITMQHCLKRYLSTYSKD